jgi:hypothetical protein
VLRRIFGPKRDEVTGGWRKLHNEELHNLYDTGKMRNTRAQQQSSRFWLKHVPLNRLSEATMGLISVNFEIRTELHGDSEK